jgi:predicted transcriptional regulator
MATALTPIKVESDTDELISHAAHFLGTTKKQIVDDAVREYVDSHRSVINDGIRAALSRLDGSDAAVVSLVTGMSNDRLNELGGVPEA